MTNSNLPPGEESILASHGVSFSLEDIPLSEIDWKESNRNQARLDEPLDREYVEELAESLLAGDKLPRCVMCRMPSGKVVIFSGRHRTEAYRVARMDSVPSAVIKTDDELLWDLLPRIFNRTGGKRQPPEHNKEHAKHAVKKWGVTIKEAANLFGISEKTLGNSLRADEYRARMNELNLPGNRLCEGHVLALAPVIDNDNILDIVARTAVQLNASELKNMLGEVKKGRTESERITIAREQRESLLGKSISNGKPQKRSKIATFRQHISSLMNTLGQISSVRQLGITNADEIQQESKRCKAAATELRRVAEGKARRVRPSKTKS